MKQFPPQWVNRLNDLVKVVRRRQGWTDIHTVVQPPLRGDHAPLLRLQKEGTLVTVPLDVRAVAQMMRTGQEGPLLAELKQAFLHVLKTAQRREKVFRAPGRPHKSSP